MKCILSIDGGGVRSIIPTIIISEIEKRTGEKAYKLFDLISASSFSSIPAALSVCPEPLGLWASEIADKLENGYGKMFDKKSFGLARSIQNPFYDKYKTETSHKFIDSLFEECELKNALTELIVPCYDLILRQPYIFKKNKAERKSADNFKLLDVVKASIATPTFFEPYPLGEKLLISGTVYANNPAMCALTEAINLMPFRGFFMVSIGCGFSTDSNNFVANNKQGFNSYEEILLSSIDGVNKTVHYEASQILSKKNYHRLQPFMQRRVKGDDYSRGTINYLKSVAEEFINQNSVEIDLICEVLSSKILK